jgi:Tol biopolymer transport system component/DNA-binding winged helix-turn-helix (wHTH) protein
MHDATRSDIVCFGSFRLDLNAGELYDESRRIRLQEQPFQLLKMLIERPSEVLTREEIRSQLWPNGTVVEFDHSINAAIKKLRMALRDSAEEPRYIETVARRGYRLIAQVDGPALQPTVTSERRPPAKPHPRWIWLAAAALFLAGVGRVAFLIYSKRERVSPSPTLTLTRLTFEGGLQFGATWSPDGNLIAYSSNRGGKFDVWVQQVGGVHPVKITNRPGHNWQPDWSPDGTQIVFRSEGEGGGLFVVPALGGPEKKISAFGYWPRWSPDGSKILFESTYLSWLWNKLYVVGLDGQPPREILRDFLQQAHILWRSIAWYPDSKRISIWCFADDQPAAFWTAPIDGGTARRSEIAPKVAEQLKGFVDARQEFRWAPSGRAIYLQAELNSVRNLWKVTVNPLTLQWESLERLTTGPGPDTGLALSRDGRKLAFTSGREQIRVWSYPFDAKAGRVMGKGEPVTPRGVDAWEADISPDGTKLAYWARRSGKWELWSTLLSSGSQTLLAEGSQPGGDNPRWSPDSKRLANGAWNPEVSDCIVRQEDGSSTPITSPGRGCIDWLPDGRWMAGVREWEGVGRQMEDTVAAPLRSPARTDRRAHCNFEPGRRHLAVTLLSQRRMACL